MHGKILCKFCRYLKFLWPIYKKTDLVSGTSIIVDDIKGCVIFQLHFPSQLRLLHAFKIHVSDMGCFYNIYFVVYINFLYFKAVVSINKTSSNLDVKIIFYCFVNLWIWFFFFFEKIIFSIKDNKISLNLNSVYSNPAFIFCTVPPISLYWYPCFTT